MKTQAITSLSYMDRLFRKKANHKARLALLTLLIIVVSVALYFPVFHWLTLKMSQANGSLHLFALLSLMGLGGYRLATMPINPFHFPVWFLPGALIWISASVIYLFNEANVGFHTLSATLFIAYIYGLAGHFLSRSVWRSMLLPVLLMILVLPFEHYLDIYLGFPLRLLSAEWASSALQFTQLPLVTVESVLMIDNKAAIVDLDCSGIKSLWIGMIFYLLLTWIERYAITLRWALIGFGLMGLLVISNVFRIVILVMLDLVLELPELAALFHQSLGLLGFVISCVIIWWVLQRFVVANITPTTEVLPSFSTSSTSAVTSSLVSSLILVIIIGFTLLYQPYSATDLTSADTQNVKPPRLQLPSKYPLHALSLTQQETDFFVSSQAHAQKYNIQLTLNDKPVTASLVLVWSRAWKTHHVPENCYLSQGYSISDKGLWNLHQQYSVRYLSLDKPGMKKGFVAQQTGVYWFQSATRTTPDYSSRVMDNILHPGREWAMVSLLWSRPVNRDDASTFITTIKQSVNNMFKGISNDI